MRRAAAVLVLLFVLSAVLFTGCENKTLEPKGEDNLNELTEVFNKIIDKQINDTPFITGLGDEFNKNLNKMWLIYGLVADGTDAVYKLGNVPCWFEWMGKKIMWTGDSGYKASLKNVIRECPMSENGYMWSWVDNDEWPSDKSLHFDNNSKFILGVYRVILWEGTDFLFFQDKTQYDERDYSKGLTVLEKVRKAMDYQLRELNGINGLLIINNGRNTGLADGDVSNYWDGLRFGFKEGYSNIYFYASLLAMEQIEKMAQKDSRAEKFKELTHLDLYEDPSLPLVIKTKPETETNKNKTVFKRIEKTSEFYLDLAKKTKEIYNKTFWNEKTGRYAGWIDINGKMHDLGITYLNTEAVSYGLASDEQAAKIYKWLDGKRIVATDTSKGKDIYLYKTAPRSNTVPLTNETGFTCFGAIPLETTGAWDESQQNGGIIFYTSHYDILGRTKHYSKDSALDRFKVIMDEFEIDELRRDPANKFGAPWKFGIIGEYPESGLVPYTFFEGFTGITADFEGIIVEPGVPDEMKYSVVRAISYQGAYYNIGADSRGSVIINKERGKETDITFKIKGLASKKNYSVIIENKKTNKTSTKKIKTDENGMLKISFEKLENNVVITVENK